MNKIAFVFPGQGSQIVGMGKDLYENYDIAKSYYNQADEIMNFSLSRVSFEGPADDLKQTQMTQPALFVHSYIITKLIGDKLKADCTAGHSLGEYTANAYAETFDFENGLKLVKTRGELMKNSGEIQPGTMAALIGLNEEQILEICDKVKDSGIAQPANYNCQGQIIISGDVNAVVKAIEVAKTEYNCRIAKRLEVSGAFHSELMKTSDSKLRSALENMKFNNAKIPVYTNVDAKAVTDSNEIKNALSRQLVSPVKWEMLIKAMIDDGVNTFYEIGSGKVLTGLIKKIHPSAEIFNISNMEDINKI